MSSLPGTEKNISGTVNNDTLIGTMADDLIRGFAGSDSIDAVGGDDYLEGNAGNDTLLGGAGDDWLIGGAGDDLYVGGTGGDQFRFYAADITGAGTASPGQDLDTIQDLTFGEKDLIVLSGFTSGTFKGSEQASILDIVNTGQGPGSGANIRSWVGMVDLVTSSAAVTASQKPDTDTLLLRIANGDGTIQTIAVENGWSIYFGLVNQAPTPAPDTNSVFEDSSVAGNVLLNDTDPNAGDNLTVSAVKTSAGAEQVVPSSGSTTLTGTYGALTLQANGSYSYLAATGAAQALPAGALAEEVFTYTVTDSGGKTATAQLVIQVTGTNDAPVAKALAGSVSESGPAITLAPDFKDVDQGDTHVVTVGTNGTIGKVLLNADGTFSYDPDGKFEALGAGQSATDTFSYTVTDSQGAASTQTVTVTIVGVNDDPTAKADFNGVVKNGKLSVSALNGVLANDSDIDGNSLSVSALNASPTAIGMATQGRYGALTLNADGSYSYVANSKPGALPSKGVAQDHFTYTVSDGHGGSKTETLTITVYDKGQSYSRGTDGANFLSGGNGSDVLDGGNGNDTLIGGNGPDVLLGGRGNDFLTGGSGPDTFVFNAKFGQDVVTDFTKGLDTIQFDKNLFSDFSAVRASAVQSGNNVIIDAGGGNTITLQNFLLSNLNGGDFLFV